MVNVDRKDRAILLALVPCAAVLILTAWVRSAEYDEQYTLFLTAGVPRPDWPETAFPAGLARSLQAGRSGLATIAHDLRVTDVHPPLYFWVLSLWRHAAGDSLFAARLLSVVCALGCLALTGWIARTAQVPAVRAMLLTLGCYGFAYTAAIARGFALAELLILGGAALLLTARGTARFAVAGGLLGAAVLTNYLAVFAAGGCLAWSILARWPLSRAGARLAGPAAATLGFLIPTSAAAWWFVAQKDSRHGQFPPFELARGLFRMAERMAGAVLGGLPLYVTGAYGRALSAVLAVLLLAAVVTAVRRWPPGGPVWMFGLAAAATPAGLLGLGFVFDNTPIEVRYLTFSLPFAALLLAATLGPRLLAALAVVQAASVAGLLAAPRTMQPARAAARAVVALAGGGVVLLPRGNDGVGVTGAFAIESPPSLPLLVVPNTDSPTHILARLAPWHRAILVPIAQDDASQAAAAAMRAAMLSPDRREVARKGEIAVYERTGGSTPASGE